MKKYLFLLFIIMMSLPLINAVGEEISYEPNTTLDMSLECFDTDSALCGSGTSCNVTVYYPNNTLWFSSHPMTNQGDYFNYTSNVTDVLGPYKRVFVCSDGSTSGYTTDKFYVGSPSTEVQYKATITAISVLFGVAILLFLGFLFTPKEMYAPRWTFFLLAILFIVISVNVVSISLHNEAGNSNIRNIFDQLGALCYYMYWFIGGLMLSMWILTVLATLASNSNIKKAERIGSMENNPY